MGKNADEMGNLAFKVIRYLCSDSVALCKIQLPHHPAGTSSERRSPQRGPRLGLAGFRPTKTHPRLLIGRGWVFVERFRIVLRRFLPTENHQYSNGSESEECVGGGFGDAYYKSLMNGISACGAGIVKGYHRIWT